MDATLGDRLHVHHLRGTHLSLVLEQPLSDCAYQRRPESAGRRSECKRTAVDGTRWNGGELAAALSATVGHGNDLFVHPPGAKAQLHTESDSIRLSYAAVSIDSANSSEGGETCADVCCDSPACAGKNRDLECVSWYLQDAYQRVSSCSELCWELWTISAGGERVAAAQRPVRFKSILDNQTAGAVRDHHPRDARTPDVDVYCSETVGHRMWNANRIVRNDEHHLHHLPLHRKTLSNVSHVGGRRRQINWNGFGDSVLYSLTSDRPHNTAAWQEICSIVSQHVPARHRPASLLAQYGLADPHVTISLAQSFTKKTHEGFAGLLVSAGIADRFVNHFVEPTCAEHLAARRYSFLDWSRC